MRKNLVKSATPSLLAAALCAACAVGAVAQPLPDNVAFRNYFGDMTFNRPVLFASYPGEDSAHVVVQQSGQILTVRRQGDSWVRTDTAAIAVLGGADGGNEQGLLGFAFHPDYAENRKYYVHYMTGSGNGAHMVAERVAGAELRPRSDDAQSTVLRMADYAVNHNGGSIGFGADGMLYIGFGDGGNANDQYNLAQNLDTLFGKILRLDVDGADAYPADDDRNYALPSDNPFVDQAGRRPEIWAYGLRNPYRWSFHPLTGEMWIGDVGQNAYEEVSRAQAGDNLGWRLREGAFCFNPSTGCPSEGLTSPALTMQRSHAASITGGTFFTGDPGSAYHGVYVFGDYVRNHVWAARVAGGTLTDSTRIGEAFNVSSFNRDAQGRVFAVSLSNSPSVADDNGVVFLLESPDMVPGPTGIRQGRHVPRSGFRLADYLRNPTGFTVRTPDGRVAESSSLTRSAGMFLVSRKDDPAATRLMTILP